MLSVEQLPDDPVLLKQMRVRECAARDAQIARRDAQIEQIRQEAAGQLEAQRLRLEAEHKAEVQALLRRFYGPRREKFDPAQLLLFGQMIDTLPVDTRAVEEESGQKLVTRRGRGRDNRHNHGRGKLPEHLERVVVEHDLPEAQKAGMVRIGCEITKQLEFKPGGLFVIQHRRYKYAPADYQTSDSGARIVIADKPAQPIEKGLAGPGLLAYVITSKLADHLPLYRLEKIFARQDVRVAGSTMCAWMAASAELLRPLHRLLIERVRQSKAIHTDDTRVPVQDEQVKGKCKSGRIWTYIGDRDHPYIDNNAAERAMKRVAIGRKNWLFAGNDAFGQHHAVLWSLIASAEAQGIDPIG